MNEENVVCLGTREYGRSYVQALNEIKNLKQQLKDKDEKISKAIEYCNGSTFEVSTREWGMLNVINYEDILEILEILESNKED